MHSAQKTQIGNPEKNSRAVANHTGGKATRPAVGYPIQRKVGFEFESQHQVIKDGDFNKKNIGTAPGFKVIGDENKMEIVTNAVDETTGGRGELEKQVGGVLNFLSGFNPGKNNLKDLGGISLSKQASEGAAYIQLAGKIQDLPFHPQATAGIKLEALADLMASFINAPLKGQAKGTEEDKGVWKGKELGEGKKPEAYAGELGWDARHEYPGMQKALGMALAQAHSLNFKSDKVKSLFSLALSYIESTSSVEPSQNHREAKFWMSFMSRSDLSAAYKTLKQEEMEEFQGAIRKIKLPGEFFSFAKGQDIASADSLSWTDWMQTLPKRDILAESGITGYGQISGKDSGYDMQSATDIGISDGSKVRRTDGIVVELRSLGANVTPESFPAFALNMFDLVRAVHALRKENSSEVVMIPILEQKEDKERIDDKEKDDKDLEMEHVSTNRGTGTGRKKKCPCECIIL